MSSLFKDMLSSEETLFRDDVALSYDFTPKLVPYREAQQKYIASCIKPLLQDKNGKNLLILGSPGIGKTVTSKKVFDALREEEMDEDLYLFHINCWEHNTTFKILLKLCEIIGYKLTHNKRTDELFSIAKTFINKKSAVFVFDEADKIEDLDLLYMLLEELYRKSIFLITNFEDWATGLDMRLKSRLSLDRLEFKPYNLEETTGILRQRLKYAFIPNVWDDTAFNQIAKKTFELRDIRQGLFLLKETGLIAENSSSRKILPKHSLEAMAKVQEFTIKNPDKLKTNSKSVLEFIKKYSGSKIGDLFTKYQKEISEISYKSFQRRVNELAKGSFISVKKVEGGKAGNTTIVNYKEEEKKLTDFEE
ncbi:MAG: AAA family ATPase [Candidatus Woesearchaeota archaeon]|jgi:cell division control protein 6|nr:AAA family ATPase [Candidatus Woesearchaeota archaeon]MDP7506556.1 AAA family ATPase [Candidatus Woesearchaeota archaeon]MDP7610563.1 AAA family ATPase [Candidatus Woesearchaeota archaeon]|tara:strand:- start:290 stop:1378 length:1089 start_codon:yes stop_codon:yes gene_type:complete